MTQPTMSYSNFNPSQIQDEGIQFTLLSKSYQNKGDKNRLLQSVQNQNHKQLNQVIMNDNASDLFAHESQYYAMGDQPSINESIRQSIQYSFVSSEYGDAKQKYQEDNVPQKDQQRSAFVMNRMNWITYLKVLFDQLEQFNHQNTKLKHVETQNFLKGLRKIKNLLPLQTRNEYYKHSSEVAFTFKEVEQGVLAMPEYITWDNVIDIFLNKQASMVTNPKAMQLQQQSRSIKQNHEVEEMHQKSFDEEEDDDDEEFSLPHYEEVDQAYQKRNQNNHHIKGSVQFEQGVKMKRNDDLFPSFALDSFVNTGFHHQNRLLEVSNQQQPALLSNPSLGVVNREDDDEACEIDSEDDSQQNEDEEEQKSNKAKKKKLEDSVHSSRTATFKQGRRNSPPVANNMSIQAQQNQQLASALSAAINVQDSYYAAIKNSQMPVNYQNAVSNQKQLYYQTHSAKTKQESASSRNNSIQYYDNNDDGQVEVASNQSFNSSSKWKSPQNNANFNQQLLLNSSLKLEFYDQGLGSHIEKSTRISSLNSIQKPQHAQNQVNNQGNPNSTILSHNSSQSSQSQKKRVTGVNTSKVSIVSSQHSSSSQTFFDIDEANKALKQFDMKSYGALRHPDQKLQVRAANLAQNELVKVPPGMEKSLQYLNLSYNRLKSLNGIELCINLKFLNVTGNMISSASSLILLQSMRELLIGSNQISLVKEICQLKNLQLLDLSYNKILEIEKVIPLQNLKKLNVLCLQGNYLVKVHNNYDALLQKLLPSVKILDPADLKDFSNLSQNLEHLLFTEPASEPVQIMIDVQSNNNNADKTKKPTTPRRNNMVQLQVNRRGGLTSQSPMPQTEQNSTAQSSSSLNTQRKQVSSTRVKEAPLPSSRANAGVARDRSYTNEQQQNIKKKDELRERSNSDISKKTKLINTRQETVSKGRSATSHLEQSYTSTLQSQNTIQSVKDPKVKRITVNNNLAQKFGSQGKITPRSRANLNIPGAGGVASSSSVNQHFIASTVQTPRHEKASHYYKKSFCTDEEPSIYQNFNIDASSDKNTIRTAPLEKKEFEQLQSSAKKKTRQIEAAVISPGSKIVKSSLLSSRNTAHRPVTTLKQRMGSVKNDSLLDDSQKPSLTYLQIAQTKAPISSTKNAFSHSFILDPSHQQQHQKPQHTQAADSQARPGSSTSQLQKFIQSSKKPQNRPQTSLNHPNNNQSLSLSSQGQVLGAPSQKLTNLPPKAYQFKSGGNPGDKKTKADMSSLSSFSNYQKPLLGNQSLNASLKSKEQSQVVQEEQSASGNASSRSMSPVLEESNNIKKLKVDLTHYMNKQ